MRHIFIDAMLSNHWERMSWPSISSSSPSGERIHRKESLHKISRSAKQANDSKHQTGAAEFVDANAVPIRTGIANRDINASVSGDFW